MNVSNCEQLAIVVYGAFTKALIKREAGTPVTLCMTEHQVQKACLASAAEPCTVQSQMYIPLR